MRENDPVGKHTGPAAPGPSRRKIGTSIATVVVAVVAWGALVYFAIHLGSQAKAGEIAAWVLLVVATLGAVCCLFLAMLSGARAWELIRTSRPAPATPGGRRAKH